MRRRPGGESARFGSGLRQARLQLRLGLERDTDGAYGHRAEARRFVLLAEVLSSQEALQAGWLIVSLPTSQAAG
jgi:hypothetical protein